MTRLSSVLGTLALVAGVVATACGSGDSSPTATRAPAATATPAGSPAATVNLAADPALGDILVTADGFTLYRFTPEADGSIQCTADCATAWPPLLLEDASTEAVAAEGLAGELGTVARPDGGTQVTYDGMPLYRFAGDAALGDTNGQGVGGNWFVVLASGEEATPTASTTPTGPGYGY